MNWSYYALAALGLLLIIGAVVKVYLIRRLNAINGLGRVCKSEQEEGIIAAIGDDESERA